MTTDNYDKKLSRFSTILERASLHGLAALTVRCYISALYCLLSRYRRLEALLIGLEQGIGSHRCILLQFLPKMMSFGLNVSRNEEKSRHGTIKYRGRSHTMFLSQHLIYKSRTADGSSSTYPSVQRMVRAGSASHPSYNQQETSPKTSISYSITASLRSTRRTLYRLSSDSLHTRPNSPRGRDETVESDE